MHLSFYLNITFLSYRIALLRNTYFDNITNLTWKYNHITYSKSIKIVIP
jgi:hypothetical protein